MEKKGQIAVGLIAIIAIAAIGGGIAFVMLTPPPGEEAEEVKLVYGIMYGPHDLDPLYAWDSASIDVIDQVTEGLLTYDVTEPDIPLVPALADSMGTWNAELDEYTITLRDDVKFHDGTDFNADAVVWWFDRLSWALNTTGTNIGSTLGITQFAELYQLPNHTAIIDDVVKISDYSVRFELTASFLPFPGLLAYSGSHFISPTFHAGDAEAWLDTATGQLCGTGPFEYDEYEAGVEVVMSKYPGYWGPLGPTKIDTLVISIITDANARNAALLSGDIDFLDDPLDALLDVFDYTPGITVEFVGQTNVGQQLYMNNNVFNNTLRRAISYAFDYDYMIDVLRLGQAVRAKSPIPLGMEHSNWSFTNPYMNVTKARMYMQQAGYGTTLNATEGGPDDIIWKGSAFMTVNYTANLGNSFREDILILLQNNLGALGIVVEDALMLWDDFTARFGGIKGYTQDYLQLCWMGWGADYLDPMNFINPLYTNRTTASNGAQYNGYLSAIEMGRDPMDLNDNVQLLMEEAMRVTDTVARGALYDRIQQLLVEEDMPCIWGYSSLYSVAYDENLQGYPANTKGDQWFYECYFEAP
jgi:peptide/nickel transport system substrate-binding protein